MKDKPDVSSGTAGEPAQHDTPAQRRGRGGGSFEVRVSGHLDDTWSEWLGGLAMHRLDNGEMILSGSIVDQAALMGVLNKLSHLNLALLSVREIRPRGKRKGKQSSGAVQIQE
jgi:hypothetical protein